MKSRLAIAIALVLLTLVAYEPVRDAGFVNLDDRVYVTQNPIVLRGLSANGIAWALQPGYAANWHPLTWISHMLDVSLWGHEPGAHHLTNLALHAASVVLLFLLLLRMTGQIWKSSLAAAAFALHPVHVESVAWISERKDVLCALFGILALWVWLDWTRRGGIGHYLGALLLFGLGLAAKPMLVTLPFLLLLLDLWPLRRSTRFSWRERLAEKLPFFALSAGACVLTLSAQSQGGTIAGVDAIPIPFRLANSACAYVGYLGHALWPQDLAVFYPYSRNPSILKSVSCGAFILGMSAALLLQARSRPWLAVGWFWWLGMLVPVIGLVQVGQQSMADRYMHLPIVGLAIAFIWGVGEIVEGRPLARATSAAGAVVLVLGWTLLSRAQATTWKDDFSLFGHATRVTERNHMAHYLLGGAFAEAGRLDEALTHYRLAVAANPRFADAHDFIGRTLEKQGRVAEAAESYRRAVEIDPGHIVARRNLAYTLDVSGSDGEAAREFEESLRLFPEDAQLRFDYGLSCVRHKRFAEAVYQFSRAIALDPDFGEAHLFLGEALANLGRLSDAIESVREGVRLLPDRLDAREVLEGMLREQADRGFAPR
ncbi:MAG: tetratricopeptide repeat protein [Planctomycetota bacterium]